MSCYVNPDGTITCSDGDDEAWALNAASKKSAQPPDAFMMGARVTSEVLGRNGLNVILLSDAEVTSLLGKTKTK